MRYDLSMPTKAVLSEAEYLRTSFPGVDQEFRDGEFVERGVPDLFHSDAQGALSSWFGVRRSQYQLFGFPELRLRVRPGRFLIPDICVFWPEKPVLAVPEEPPLIAIEILSPDDRMSEVLDKLQEYKEWGVVHVWMVDPRRKKLYEFQGGLQEVKAFAIPEVGIEIPPTDIFD